MFLQCWLSSCNVTSWMKQKWSVWRQMGHLLWPVERKVCLLVSRMKALLPKLLSYHCIIHRLVLCCKLSDDFANVMLMMMTLINFIRSNSSLQHRLFRSFLDESSVQYGDLLLHTDVRRLSKGLIANVFVWVLLDGNLKITLKNNRFFSCHFALLSF